jgi:transcription elongation factor SPT5
MVEIGTVKATSSASLNSPCSSLNSTNSSLSSSSTCFSLLCSMQGLVPISEMVAAVKFNESEINVRKGQWVRMKRGIYGADLGKVVRTSDQNTLITVKLVPRIDIQALEEAQRGGSANNKRKRPSAANKPPQKLFDRSEITQLGGVVTSKTGIGRGFSIYNGNRYKHGYLYKDLPVSGLQTENIQPTADEIEKFHQKLPYDEASESEESAEEEEKFDENRALANKTQFVMGDHVIVSSGPMKNITARIISLNKTIATLQPDANQVISMHIEVSTMELRKFFRLGDHVKVISGIYRSETGMITQVGERDDPEADVVSIYSDISQREIKVGSGEIIESSEVSTGRDTLGNYELFDLVQISGDVVGIIVKVEIASFKLLTNRGIVQSVRLQEIGMKRHSKFAAALDSQGNQLVKDDVVVVQLGPNAGKQGTIKHIHRSTLFLFSRAVNENGGIFIAQAKHTILLGQQYSKGSAAGAAAPAAQFIRSRVGEKDPMLGRVVTITGGQYKSFMGVVFEVSGENLKVELHALARKITLPRAHVADRKTSIAPGGLGYNYLAAQTPLLGSRTPAYELASQTPAHEGFGSMTPAHEAFGGRTPNQSMTPSRDVWSAQTPHHPGIGDDSEEDEEDEFTRNMNRLTHSQQKDSSTNNNNNTNAAKGEEDEEEKESKGGAVAQFIFPIGARIRCKGKSASGPDLVGTIMNVLKNGTYKVHYDEEKSKSAQKSVQPADVRGPVEPVKGSQVIVLNGPDKGKVGLVQGINAGQAIVTAGNSLDMYDINNLCQYQPAK